MWGRLPPGSISERMMTMDGLEPCGHTAHLSIWSEIAMLLTARELPAIYRDAARNRSAVFDNTAPLEKS